MRIATPVILKRCSLHFAFALLLCAALVFNGSAFQSINRYTRSKESLSLDNRFKRIDTSQLKFSTEDIGVGIYDLQIALSRFIETQLSTPTPVSISIIYASGLLTAFSPCSISLLPLTMAYLGDEQGKSSNALVTRAGLYAAGR
jgi:hypothetical protein